MGTGLIASIVASLVKMAIGKFGLAWTENERVNGLIADAFMAGKAAERSKAGEEQERAILAQPKETDPIKLVADLNALMGPGGAK